VHGTGRDAGVSVNHIAVTALSGRAMLVVLVPSSLCSCAVAIPIQCARPGHRSNACAFVLRTALAGRSREGTGGVSASSSTSSFGISVTHTTRFVTIFRIFHVTDDMTQCCGSRPRSSAMRRQGLVIAHELRICHTPSLISHLFNLLTLDMTPMSWTPDCNIDDIGNKACDDGRRGCNSEAGDPG
jgi:hypothetical protein